MISLSGDNTKDIADVISAGVQAEGAPFTVSEDSIIGRWAGDRVVLVGDYDSSRLWDELPRYRNVSEELVDTWNVFVEIDNLQLTYKPDCSCKEVVTVDEPVAVA